MDGQPEAVPASAESDEQDDPNWLPDEQQKVFTNDAIARYAKRYSYTQEQIEQNPQLRQLLHDKINSDSPHHVAHQTAFALEHST